MAEEKKMSKTMEIGIRFYGETFEYFQKIAELTDFIPAFKDFYYQEKLKNPEARTTEIIREFNTQVTEPEGRRFHPYSTLFHRWCKKWDMDLAQQLKRDDLQMIERKNVHQIIKTRDDERQLVLGGADYNQLEQGTVTLGGELLNDAMQMLRDDQELEEVYDDDTLIKRRNYVVNVFAHATKLVHGKAALMLKASEEKRNTAGFLMNLLARATAGKMTDEEMNLLKTAYTPHNEEQSTHI